MKFHVLFFLTTFFSLMAYSNRVEENSRLLERMGYNYLNAYHSLDTIISFQGYEVRYIKHNNELKHLGLYLFNDQIKESVDFPLLNFVETALLAKILGEEIEGDTDFIFHGGDITSLKKIRPSMSCKIDKYNSKILSFEWEINKDKTLTLKIPINYYNAFGGNRREIEKSLIENIKKGNDIKIKNIEFKYDELIPYGRDAFVLIGPIYLNKAINQNIYFKADSIPSLIWDFNYPLESINNLFVNPTGDMGNLNLNVIILKHDYGEKEEISTTWGNFLSTCENEGCQPFWGIESYDGTKLVGSLFLHNWQYGYNHVLKIECNPNEVIKGVGEIKAYASLYIPANNIKSLFESEELFIIN